jgi:hypothetical protein
MIYWSVLLCAFLFAETTATPVGSPEKDEKTEIKNQLLRLSQEIEKLNLNLRCSKKSDCDVVAVGHRLCGGPQNYIVISKKNRSVKKIQEKAAAHSKLSQEYNEKHSGGMMGICSMAIKPELSCQKNKCVAVSSDG